MARPFVSVSSLNLQGSLSAWRAALFAALGFGAAGCAGAASTPSPDLGAEPATAPATDPSQTSETTATDSAQATQTAAKEHVGPLLKPPPEPAPAPEQPKPAHAPPDLTCNNPTSFSGVEGVSADTGYIACDAGWYHRSARGECPSRLPRAEAVTASDGSVCNDSSCTENPHGFCGELGGIGPGPNAVCFYGCVRDDECGPGAICFCGDPVGICVPASCKTDADCPDSLCVGSRNPPPCGKIDNVYFACAAPEDECLARSQCDDGLKCEQGSFQNGPDSRLVHRACGVGAQCGRPFLVAGEARQAPTQARSDWSARIAPELRGLDARMRSALAAHWTRLGQMEHASVAAFARFILELLAAGAPAELVAAAQAALGDEIEHARLCFGLAGAYAAAPIGPGPLSAQGVLDQTGLRATVSAAIHEACIGETLAAAEACEALAEASDPAVRQVLMAVVRDESAHAELGWKFLQWALASGDPELRDLARREVRRAIETIREEVTSPADTADPMTATLAGHGLCPEHRRHAARRAALEQVVVPLSRALLGEETWRAAAGDDPAWSAMAAPAFGTGHRHAICSIRP